MRLFLVIFLFISTNVFSAEMSSEKMPKHDWSFDGITGTFDRAAAVSYTHLTLPTIVDV